MIVRRLLAPDITRLVPMAQEHCAQWGKELDHAHFTLQVLKLMQSGGIFLGAFDGEEMVASAAGVIAPELFSGEPTLYGLWWYVGPERRGGAVALRILRTLIREAGEDGAERVEMAVQSSGNSRVAAVYGTMGLAATTTSLSGVPGCLQQ